MGGPPLTALRPFVALAAVALAVTLVPPSASEAPTTTLDVRLPWLIDTAVLEPVEGHLDGTLVESGARVRLVDTAEGGLIGLLFQEGVLHWVRVDDGVLVSDASTEAVVPPHLDNDALEPIEDLGEPTLQANDDDILRLRIVADKTLVDREGAAWFPHAQNIVALVEWIYWAHFDSMLIEAEYWSVDFEPYGNPALMCGGVGTYIRNIREWEEPQHPVASNPWDILHVLTGKSFPDAIGCAYIAQVDTPWAYSITQIADTGDDDLKRDALIMAHEVGHNFGGTHERAAPTPGGTLSAAACIGIPVTIMYPGCQTLEPPVFSDGRGVSPSTLATAGVMRDGGNMPWMRAYADPRV